MVIEIRQFNIPILLAALLAGCSTATRLPDLGWPHVQTCRFSLRLWGAAEYSST
jgi:hypothetical protein